jgi:pyruvate ferredoxin oxidoreductase alpha subunit
MPERDSGWVQIYCEDAQESYDAAILSVRLAEHPDVLTPVFVCQDGFITSHCYEAVEFLSDDAVSKFVGERKPPYPLLDVDNPVSYGSFVMSEDYFEMKRNQMEGLRNTNRVCAELSRELARLTGREFAPVERYMTDDAEYVIVIMASAAGVAKDVVDALRGRGIKAGCLRVRMFRPFPADEAASALEGKRAVAVLDRSVSPGGTAPLAAEVRSALYGLPSRVPVYGYIFGLGGRDFFPHDAESVFDDLINGGDPGSDCFIGLRDKFAAGGLD